jgi:hypothetical protein
MTQEQSNGAPGPAHGSSGFPNAAEESRLYPEPGAFNRDSDQTVIAKNIAALETPDMPGPGYETAADPLLDKDDNGNAGGRESETGSPARLVRERPREQPPTDLGDPYSTYLDDNGQTSDDAIVTGMAEDSFPASDPPGFTNTNIGSPRTT